jgi:hypothetical protein
MVGVDRVLRQFAEEIERLQLVPDEDTAHHEAGHLVVGFACGSKVGGAITCCQHEVEGVGLVWGFTEFAGHRSLAGRVMSLLAGPLAELRYKRCRSSMPA